MHPRRMQRIVDAARDRRILLSWHMRVQEKTWSCLELARSWQELAIGVHYFLVFGRFRRHFIRQSQKTIKKTEIGAQKGSKKESKGTQKGFKGGRRGPKGVQEGPWGLQEGSKSPPGSNKGQAVVLLGSLLGLKMVPRRPKANLKTIKKHYGFYSVFSLGAVQEAAWEASKNGSKNGGARMWSY